MAFEKVFLRISHLFPRKWMLGLRDVLVKGGFSTASYREFMGLLVCASLFSSAAASALLYFSFSFQPEFAAAGGLLVLLVVAVGIYWFFTSAAFSRGQKIESVLPDALRLISANLRAGMTVENAVWSAARPEFGPFRDEISKVAADTFGGKSIEDALLAMPSRVESQIVERSITLMVDGLRLGGRMTDLLDEVASSVASYQGLQSQIATSTTTYSIFIMFAALFAAPMLFAVSAFYVQMNSHTVSSAAMPDASSLSAALPSSSIGSNLPLGLAKIQQGGITYADIQLFSIAVLIVTAFFAALLIWQIKEGNPRRGLGYSPIFVAVSLAIFAGGVSLLEALFKGML